MQIQVTRFPVLSCSWKIKVPRSRIIYISILRDLKLRCNSRRGTYSETYRAGLPEKAPTNNCR